MNEDPPSSEAASRAASSRGERGSSPSRATLSRGWRAADPLRPRPGSLDLRAAYLAERAESVEKRIAVMRMAILALAGFVYVFLVDQAQTVRWLAYSVLGFGGAYALLLYVFQPKIRIPPRTPTWVTSLFDAFLLNLWLFATGGIQSDFYVVIYASVIAVAFQSGYRAAVVAAGLYATSYVALLALLGQLAPHVTEVVIRAGFVFLIAPLGGLLAREALEQGSAKLEMEELARAARKAEEERERSLTFLRATLEATADGILVQDGEGRIVRFNRKCVEMWRIPDYVVKAKDPKQAILCILDQLRDPDAFMARLRELQRHPQEESFDVIEFKDGRVFERHVRSQRLGGKCVGRVWNFRDVTSRVRAERALAFSEKKYRTLFEDSKDAVFISSADGRLIDVNPACVEMFGYASKEEMLRIAPADYLVDREATLARRNALIENGFLRDFEVEVKKKDGEKITVLVTAMVARDESGKVLEIRGVSRDVTARRRLENQLRESQKLEALGRLAAGVAHEINNPLTYVLSHLEALKEELPDPTKNGGVDGEASRRLSEALEGAERVQRIVRDLKSFSRPDEKKHVVDLNQVVNKSVSLAENQVRHRARLVKNLGDSPRVLADEGRLSQVVLNLLMNAAQAIGEGAAERNEIRLRTWVNANEVCLEVGDTGRGIPADQIEKLFDPFFTTKPVGEGLGLGLSICHNIVTSYGGRIEVDSVPGRGSRFLVRLPLCAEPLDRETVAPSVGENRRQALRRGRVLVVDDEPLVRSAATMILRIQHEVIEAGSGREALAILEHDPGFDVVLCDLMMPDVSGMDVYRTLADRCPALSDRVVFMTGGAFTRSAQEFLQQVPNSSVDKPFTAADLLSAIQRALPVAESRETVSS